MKHCRTLFKFNIFIPILFWKITVILLLIIFSISVPYNYSKKQSKYLEMIPTLHKSIIFSPNVTEEMLSYSFWFKNKSGKQLLKSKEIKEFNTKTLYNMKERKVMHDLLQDDFSDKNVAYAITTDRVNVRTFPDTIQNKNTNNDLYFDENQLCEIYAFEAVIIIKTTNDREYSYIISSCIEGWVPSDKLARCHNKNEWIDFQKIDDFLIVTGKDIHFDIDPYHPEIRKICLSMGTKIPLADSNKICKNQISNRNACHCYMVKIPARDAQGYLQYEIAYLPMSLDLSLSYLPYTEENILKLAYKHLGSLYGWGGMYDCNDCSGYLCQIFRCFGFQFPRNSSQIINVGEKKIDLSQMDTQEKYRVIKKIPAGSLLYFKGHIMMYLGEYQGELYVINALNSIHFRNDKKISHPRSVMINSLNEKRPNGHLWMEDLSKACIIR